MSPNNHFKVSPIRAALICKDNFQICIALHPNQKWNFYCTDSTKSFDYHLSYKNIELNLSRYDANEWFLLPEIFR